MIRISKMADYAVVILASLSRDKEGRMSAALLSQETHLPEPTVSKILKSLAKAEIVKSTRGTNGGYILIGKASDISIARVITAIDGPITITACADVQVPDCNLTEVCGVRGRWNDVNIAIRDALENLSLGEMTSKCNKTRYDKKEAAYGRH